MNVHCVECGCRLRFADNDRWISLTRAPCVSATSEHLPDPLDIALRRLNMAKDSVHDAKAEVQEAQEDYDYLRAVRVKR